ncbi:MAG: AAA family ATPase [Burkholderiales bacterium]|nr:AAA family ATPase [Burkholderiales bacterium]
MMDHINVGKEGYPAIFKLWALRALVLLRWHFLLLDNYSSCLAEAIGADESFDMETQSSEKRDEARSEALNKLRQLHAEAEKEMKDVRVPETVYRNIGHLSDIIGLNGVERRVMEFAVLSRRFFSFLRGGGGDIRGRGNIEGFLSMILGIPEKDVRRALSREGKLKQSGVFNEEEDKCRYGIDGAINVFPESLFNTLDCAGVESFMSLFRSVIREESAPSLSLGDYSHIDSTLKVLLPYLDKALKNQKKGVNIFIYGRPGTGKTELTRVLARELQCKALFVASEDESREAANEHERARAFCLAQQLFSSSGNFLVFDEAGDVFGEGARFSRKEKAQESKGWFVKALEENKIPTIWLANSIWNIDPALVRRFDMIFEVPVPARRQRETLIQKSGKDFVSEKTVKKMAQVEVLTPAVITRASSVVREALFNQSEVEKERAFEQLVSCTLEAQGHKPLKKDDPNILPEYYGLDYLNTGADLFSIAEGMEAIKSGRLCLYGPPGTGKTAFARWLAQRLNIPLNVKRGSDLISMWCGETERNIARAFLEAERDGALLLIDEADSFLQDRRNAARSWEITEVNEMLTQMESFSGIFVASTNLMGCLDPAALRRFDAKLKFGYLSAEQALRLLQSQCRSLGISAPTTDKPFAHIERLAVLTPGDFATVARRHRFQPFKSVEEIVGKLEEECRIKEDFRSAIGFA